MNLHIPKPDYNGNSIVNLMSAIEGEFGGSNPYPPSPHLVGKTIDGVKNVIIIVIDGLGIETYQNSFTGTAIKPFYYGQVTSVFPSTTAAAMTAFYTGLAPYNHGILAWFTYFKEIGMIGIMPPLLVRHDKSPIFSKQQDPEGKLPIKLLGISSIFERIDAHGYLMLPANIRGPYNEVMSGPASFIGFNTVDEWLDRTYNVASNNPGKKLIIGYWPSLDSMAHEKGMSHPDIIAHGTEILNKVGGFLENKANKLEDTLVVVTADHGQVETQPKHLIPLDAHPELERTLTMPLSGEPRAVFCFVRPSMVEKFECYVRENLDFACDLANGVDVIKEGYFGNFGTQHCSLFDRVGDYILFMKEDYVIKDLLLGEHRNTLIGHHGGISFAEMNVPLFISRN